MYSVKPHYNTNDAKGVDPGNVMYSMKPLYQSAADGSAVDPAQMDLLSRQEHLISNIEQQIRRIDEIVVEAKVSIHNTKCSSPAAPSTAEITEPATLVTKLNVTWPETIFYPLDIVVQADPTRLPITPWALRKLLGDAVMIRTHAHSTYKGPLPPVYSDIARTNRTNAGVKIIFTVIFRNVKEMEFMVDPVSQTAIAGEANLLRYICRMFPIFSALSVFDETVSDHYVDIICSGLVGGKSKEQQNALKAIEVQLAKKGGLLVCDKLTPADFSLHAALQKNWSLSLPSTVQKWQKVVFRRLLANRAT